MNHIESTKTSARISTSVALGATHSHEIDTYGADYASVDVVFSHFTAATSNYAAVLKLQQTDTSGSNYVDLGAPFTVTAGAGRTTGVGLNGAVCRFNVDLRGKRRYLNVVASPGAAAGIATVARLSKMEDNPADATSAGVNNFVSG